MPRPGQIKFPFAIRTLEERLTLELKWLDLFHKNRNDHEEWAIHNIESCEHRIVELRHSIEMMKTVTD